MLFVYRVVLSVCSVSGVQAVHGAFRRRGQPRRTASGGNSKKKVEQFSRTFLAYKKKKKTKSLALAGIPGIRLKCHEKHRAQREVASFQAGGESIC